MPRRQTPEVVEMTGHFEVEGFEAGFDFPDCDMATTLFLSRRFAGSTPTESASEQAGIKRDILCFIIHMLTLARISTSGGFRVSIDARRFTSRRQPLLIIRAPFGDDDVLQMGATAAGLFIGYLALWPHAAAAPQVI